MPDLRAAAADRAGRLAGRAPAWSLAILAILSVQVGSAGSIGLFAAIGSSGTAWLRLSAGAVLFLLLKRPRLRGRPRREILGAVALGATTGLMTSSFLAAIERIPMGTAVAIEFLGPLLVAVIGTRQLRRLLWPVLALGGVLILTEPWVGSVDLLGIVFAIGGGTGWAIYIVLTAIVGDRFEGLEGLSITIPVAAVVAGVVGVPQAWGHLAWGDVVYSLGLAVLLPVLPYSLELLALRRLSTSTFGTLMALEPAMAAGIGALMLGQVLTPLQLCGMAAVVIAGVGAVQSGTRETPHPPAADVPIPLVE